MINGCFGKYLLKSTVCPYISRFCICRFNQPQIENNIFHLGAGNLRRPNRIHCSASFHIRDLSIHGFQYPRGSWNKNPRISRDICIIHYLFGAVKIEIAQRQTHWDDSCMCKLCAGRQFSGAWRGYRVCSVQPA